MAECWRDESGLSLQRLCGAIFAHAEAKDAHRAGRSCPCFALREITAPGNSREKQAIIALNLKGFHWISVTKMTKPR